MIYFLIIILDTFLTQLVHYFNNLSPVTLEIIKVVTISFGWIGGLALFMWLKDKRNKHAVIA